MHIHNLEISIFLAKNQVCDVSLLFLIPVSLFKIPQLKVANIKIKVQVLGTNPYKSIPAVTLTLRSPRRTINVFVLFYFKATALLLGMEWCINSEIC